MGLALIELVDKSQAIESAEASLAIYEQIEDPNVIRVRSDLEKWHREG